MTGGPKFRSVTQDSDDIIERYRPVQGAQRRTDNGRRILPFAIGGLASWDADRGRLGGVGVTLIVGPFSRLAGRGLADDLGEEEAHRGNVAFLGHREELSEGGAEHVGGDDLEDEQAHLGGRASALELQGAEVAGGGHESLVGRRLGLVYDSRRGVPVRR